MFDTVKKNIEKKKIIDIDDNTSINFNDIIDFSKDITDGKINNFNKEKKYNEKFKDIEKNLENKKKDTNDIKLYIIYVNRLKNILFTPKKSSDMPTKIPQIIRKRDDKIRTSSPLDNIKKPSILESINKYEAINLDNINMLINRIHYEISEGNNIVDIVDIGNNNKIYFKNLINFLQDIRNGKIDDFNKEMKYEKRLKDTEVKLAKRAKFSDYAKVYERYINMLKKELFTPKKSRIPIKVDENR